MSVPFVQQVNDLCRNAALEAVVETWRDLRGFPAGERVIEVYANSSARAVEDLVVLRALIDAELQCRIGGAP